MYASIKQELVELKIIHSQNVLVFMLHAGGGGTALLLAKLYMYILVIFMFHLHFVSFFKE